MLARPAIAALVAAALSTGCGEGSPVDPGRTIPDAEAAHAGGSDGVSTADVVTFADDELVVGSSRLVRNAAGVSYRLSTSGLEPRTAATLWIVMFNRPENCAIEGFCGVSEDDFVNPDVRTDVMFAAGSLVGGSGKATFAGRRAVRDKSGSLHEVLGLPLFGLEDAREAEIHLVVRTHGPVIADMMPAMISTFNGGCDSEDPILGDLSEVIGHPVIGPEGPNDCEDLQFAVHQP